MTRERWITEVCSWVGTPFKWQGRVKGPTGGSDCWGLVVASCWACGYIPKTWDVRDYSRRSDLAQLTREHLPQWFDRLMPEDMEPGDVVTIHHGSGTLHMGVLYAHPHGGLGIVHSEDWRQIVMHRLSEERRRMVADVWRARYEH